MFVVVDYTEGENPLCGFTYTYRVSYCKTGYSSSSCVYTNSYEKALKDFENLKTHSTITWIKIEMHDGTTDHPVVILQYTRLQKSD